MASRARVTDDVCEKIRLILHENPNGLEITRLPSIYIHKNGNFSCKQLGFKGWAEMLASPEIQKYSTIFNSGKCLRLRTSDDICILQPVGKPSTYSNNGNTQGSSSDVFAAVKKPPPSPIDGTSSSHSISKFVPRPFGSDISAAFGKRPGNDAMDTGNDSKRLREMLDAQSNSETDFSEQSHVSISAYNKGKLSKERSKISWIDKEGSSRPLNFNNLILERSLQNAETALYIDTTFCDKLILENLMDVKNYIRRVNTDKFNTVRARLNQFEFQKGAIFQHGGAIKIANIDALMGMALSNPKGPDGGSLVKSNELLYFADVYGGPGGCAEYLLWKKKWQAKGFGITPRAHMNYNLVQAEHFPRESFETFYGENATDGSGEITRPFYLSKFVSFVKEGTDNKGVHVMIASGGEKSTSTDEDQKEIRCKYLFLAEFLIALQVVREGGMFVMRCYDLYTPFTVGMIYLMYRTFEQVAIYKPESSLPASSEKYILCKWKKPHHQTREISDYLSECHKMDWLTKRARKGATENFAEITHLFSLERMKDSYSFLDYIRRTNFELGKRQYDETTILATSIKDKNEERDIHNRQTNIQEKCLSLWGIPDRVREKPKYSKATTPAIRAMKLLTPYSYDFIGQTDREGEIEMSMNALLSDLTNPKEWNFMGVGRERGFFMCLGGNQIFQYENGIWNPIMEVLELMNNTLVYADLVDEFEIKGAKQTIWTGFHIIDALVLGGKDVRSLPSNERSDMITKYALSMNKTSRDDLSAVRPKVTYEMDKILKFFTSVTEHKVRSRDGVLTTSYLCPVDTSTSGVNKKFLIRGVLFMKRFKTNFVPADFRFCLLNRLYWVWNDKVNVKIPEGWVPGPGPVEHQMDQEDQDEDNVVPVHAVTLLQHLSLCNKE